MISNPSDYAVDSSAFTENESVLNGFRDENICGAGATCVVYRMYINGLRLAVKRLNREFVTDPRYVAAYRKEFQIGRQLKHDALPIYRAFHEGFNDVYIVMDYIDGISLCDFINTAEGDIYFSSENNARRFFSELLNVVCYLHRSGVVHCDLKPANIMLRHTDRGVMLIDLDKAYSDTLDRTHGGTAGFTDALKSGGVPTVAKDFSALGNIVDYLAEKVRNFNAGKLRKFRRECENPQVSSELLANTLKPRNHIHWWLIGLAACLITGMAFFFSIDRKDHSISTGNNEIAVDSVREGSVNEEPSAGEIIPANGVKSVPEEKTSVEISVDFDKGMPEYMEEAEKGFKILSSGTASDRELQDLLFKLSKSYHDKYMSLMAEYKTLNPEIPGIDVELAMARAVERSKAAKMHERFTKALADTMKIRHPESYDNL